MSDCTLLLALVEVADTGVVGELDRVVPVVVVDDDSFDAGSLGRVP